MLQVIPSVRTNYSKNRLFISANTFGKYIVGEDYCFPRNVD